ncbi:MAG TPA: hypothetical protein ENK56_01765 [Chloroflexi bacterium]|nr:hypothetical protein [Chloroflexota bacterium]
MGKRRLPFFWDYDLGEEDLRAILVGDDEERKVWVISRLLNATPWDEIWTYLTVDDIGAHFPRLRFRSSRLRELWAHAGDATGPQDSGPTRDAQVRGLGGAGRLLRRVGGSPAGLA